MSFGFVWQDKEFRLAKLKANYIYDHYMCTPEAIAKAGYGKKDRFPLVDLHLDKYSSGDYPVYC